VGNVKTRRGCDKDQKRRNAHTISQA
jgi:hypothetical protein